MSARRPLLTATAAGALLCALWFVPSANATAEKEVQAAQAQEVQQARAEQHSAVTEAAADTPAEAPADAPAPAGPDTGSDASDQGLRLADTGGVNTTPYLLGGTAFLGTGAAFVAFSMRRAA